MRSESICIIKYMFTKYNGDFSCLHDCKDDYKFLLYLKIFKINIIYQYLNWFSYIKNQQRNVQLR